MNIDLPNNFANLSDKNKELVTKYLNQLNPIEKKAYSIAKEHLGSSFNILKSNGYNDWLKNMK